MLLGCDSDDLPKGPDLVVCNCECQTTTPTGTATQPGGCTTEPSCDPSCGDLTCTTSGGCRETCVGAPALNSVGISRGVPLRVCVDADDSSLVARACQQRCDDHASGDARECVMALLEEVGLADEVSDVVPDDILSRVNPDSAQSVADIIGEECGTWLLDSLTGTCGFATQGLDALKELLFCFWSPTNPLNVKSPGKFRQCVSTGSSLFRSDGCPEYTQSPDGTPVGDSPLAASEEVSSSSSAVTIAGPDVASKTVRPSGFASTGRVGPIVMVSQLNLTLPSTTLSVDDNDVPLQDALFFLERPVATALTAGNAVSFAVGKVRAILSGKLDGHPTSVGAVNTTPITGHYDELTGAFDLRGSFQLSGFPASFSMDLTFQFTNRPPVADAGPDQVVECGLQTREATVQLSAAGSRELDSGDSIARYVWTAGNQLVSDGSSATLAVAQLGLGTRIATLTTVDTRGSMSRDTALISVVDSQPPVFPALPPVTNSLCQPGVDEVHVPTPVVSDACSPSVDVTGAVVALNGAAITPIPILNQTLQLPAGTYQISWSATDQSGNVSQAQQTLVVAGGVQASAGIDVRDRASVRVAGGAYATLVNSSTGTLSVGVEAHTGSLLSRANVALRDRSFVHGDVLLAGELTRQNQTTVTGAITTMSSLGLPAGRDLANVVFPSANQGGVALEPNQLRTIAPGSYSSIVVKAGAKLTLPSGTYFASSLQLEPGAELRMMQPVQLYVSGAVIHRGALVTVAGSASDFVWGLSGSQTVFLEAAFPGGALVAPNAKVVVGSLGPNAFIGQLFARELEIQPDATVTCAAVAGSVPPL